MTFLFKVEIIRERWEPPRCFVLAPVLEYSNSPQQFHRYLTLQRLQGTLFPPAMWYNLPLGTHGRSFWVVAAGGVRFAVGWCLLWLLVGWQVVLGRVPMNSLGLGGSQKLEGMLTFPCRLSQWDSTSIVWLMLLEAPWRAYGGPPWSSGFEAAWSVFWQHSNEPASESLQGLAFSHR